MVRTPIRRGNSCQLLVGCVAVLAPSLVFRLAFWSREVLWEARVVRLVGLLLGLRLLLCESEEAGGW
jgi:hypothetical protein